MNKTDFIYENEESIPSDLICSICSSPFIEPVEHETCGIEFCRKCIQKWHLSCPHCRESPLSNLKSVTAKRLLNQLNELKVKCPVCNKVCQRSDLPEHIKSCPIGIWMF